MFAIPPSLLLRRMFVYVFNKMSRNGCDGVFGQAVSGRVFPPRKIQIKQSSMKKTKTKHETNKQPSTLCLSATISLSLSISPSQSPYLSLSLPISLNETWSRCLALSEDPCLKFTCKTATSSEVSWLVFSSKHLIAVWHHETNTLTFLLPPPTHTHTHSHSHTHTLTYTHFLPFL